MIKIFRKIRQKLLTENKFSKYLIYAIGEILLVVIGILIALQLNNLNEDRKIEVIRQGYYHQLLEDLNKDKIYIEKTISHFDSINNDINAYYETFKVPNLSIEQVLTNLFKLEIDKAITIRFNTNIIESLENTGDIKIIPPVIRNKLSDLKRFQDRTIYISDANSDQHVDILQLITLEFGSGSISSRLTNQPRLTELLKLESKSDKLFIMMEAGLTWKVGGESTAISRLKKILSDENILINLINDELKK